MKTPGYTSRDFDLIHWERVQEVDFLIPPPLHRCPGDAGVNIWPLSVRMP